MGMRQIKGVSPKGAAYALKIKSNVICPKHWQDAYDAATIM